jgi:hypothetical protein
VRNIILHFSPLWRNSPTRTMVASFLRFQYHTQWHTTVGMMPLYDWSARRGDLYLTTHNSHKRQASMPPGGIWTRSPSERVAAHPFLRPLCHWDRHYISHTHTHTHTHMYIRAISQMNPAILWDIEIVWPQILAFSVRNLNIDRYSIFEPECTYPPACCLYNGR